MSPAEQQLARVDSPAGEERTLTERLHGYSRLLALVADEIAAVESGDAARRRELADARAELIRELQAPGEDEAPGDAESPVDPVAELASLVSGALEELRQTEEEEQRSRARWISLEGDTLKAMQGVRLSAQRGGRYLELAQLDAQLDVRF